MYHDASNGARARSARIRSSHEYEATELDAMERRTLAHQERAGRPSRIARLRAFLGRCVTRRSQERAALDAHTLRSPGG